MEHHTETLRRCISACLEHELCGLQVSGRPLPTPDDRALPKRCVDVWGLHPHLRYTEGLKGKYLTLSHRWNEDTERAKTTAPNVDARMQGNWDCKFPQLFIDVFTLARGLRVRYVWIDSLCIVQSGDRGYDWEQEAPKMGTYYSNSYLNVMAIAPGPGGLYPERLHSLKQFARLPFRTAEGL